MEEIDPIEYLRRVVQVHGSQRRAAEAMEISEPYLSDLLHGRRECSKVILQRLGLRRIVVRVDR